MATGTVKWFNNAKGYGFICPQEGGEDIFAHFSAIKMEGYKSLKAGQAVIFDINHGPKGLHAVDIRPDAAASDNNNSHSSVKDKSSISQYAEVD